jgi:hypothetical protein
VYRWRCGCASEYLFGSRCDVVPSTTLPIDHLLSSRNTLHSSSAVGSCPGDPPSSHRAHLLRCGRSENSGYFCEKEEKRKKCDTRTMDEASSNRTVAIDVMSTIRDSDYMPTSGKGAQPRCFLTRPDLGYLLHQLQHFVRSTAFMATTPQWGYSAQLGYTRSCAHVTVCLQEDRHSRPNYPSHTEIAGKRGRSYTMVLVLI